MSSYEKMYLIPKAVYNVYLQGDSPIKDVMSSVHIRQLNNVEVDVNDGGNFTICADGKEGSTESIENITTNPNTFRTDSNIVNANQSLQGNYEAIHNPSFQERQNEYSHNPANVIYNQQIPSDAAGLARHNPNYLNAMASSSPANATTSNVIHNYPYDKKLYQHEQPVMPAINNLEKQSVELQKEDMSNIIDNTKTLLPITKINNESQTEQNKNVGMKSSVETQTETDWNRSMETQTEKLPSKNQMTQTGAMQKNRKSQTTTPIKETKEMQTDSGTNDVSTSITSLHHHIPKHVEQSNAIKGIKLHPALQSIRSPGVEQRKTVTFNNSTKKLQQLGSSMQKEMRHEKKDNKKSNQDLQAEDPEQSTSHTGEKEEKSKQSNLERTIFAPKVYGNKAKWDEVVHNTEYSTKKTADKPDTRAETVAEEEQSETMADDDYHYANDSFLSHPEQKATWLPFMSPNIRSRKSNPITVTGRKGMNKLDALLVKQPGGQTTTKVYRSRQNRNSKNRAPLLERNERKRQYEPYEEVGVFIGKPEKILKSPVKKKERKRGPTKNVKARAKNADLLK
jgi:hypothetical protein